MIILSTQKLGKLDFLITNNILPLP